MVVVTGSKIPTLHKKPLKKIHKNSIDYQQLDKTSKKNKREENLATFFTFVRRQGLEPWTH